MKVFLNPGHHPGIDSGAVNLQYELQEAELVRNIGAMVEKYLVLAGLEVESLQSDNLAGESPCYPNVWQCANDSGADLFVSLHCNSAVNESAKGTETLVYSFGEKSEQAALAIQSQLVTTLGTCDRGVKERPNLIVLKNTIMPAVLVEIAFISNEKDVQLLIYRQDDIARAIARGITDYFLEGREYV